MKNVLKLLIYLIALTVIIPGCAKDDEPTGNNSGTYDYTTILRDYADNVVIATYHDLDEEAQALKNACETFKNSSTQANLDAAVAKWKSARSAWEASEAFLFGPVSTSSLDPALDTWPLDETSLNSVLSSNASLTPAYIRDLGYSLRGFHTIEYLLFKDGQNRDATTLTDRDKEYLVSCAIVLAEDAADLHHQWEDSYGATFKSAGNGNPPYPNQNDAIQEIITGIKTIADEVGNGKLGDPYSTKDVQSVESQFSWNSLEDFKNNIRSIKNAYLGGYNTDRTGLDDFVKSKNASLHTRTLSEIDAAITAIDAIPHPFRNNLNASASIEAAMAACAKIFVTFENDIESLIAE